MAKVHHVEQFNRQREAQINTLLGYLDALITDRLALLLEQHRAVESKRPIHEELKEMLDTRIAESRKALRNLLDLLLP